MAEVKRGAVSIFVPHLGCPHKCSFCDQNAISGVQKLPNANDVKNECELAISLGVVPENTEIAFFGGSFTAIPRDYMFELLEAAQPYLRLGFKGIRISTRPDCIDENILSILKKYGVRSVELGAQSMDDNILALNGRGHTTLDVENASKLVKQFGFTLGLQMMVGLYGSTPELDILSAKKIIELEPKEARIYPAVILSNTRLGDLYLSGEYIPYSLSTGVKLCTKLLEMFYDAGISVIKLGLHASKSIEKNMLGGLYHPAFRELCESEIYKNRITKLLNGDKVATFTVPSRELSKALGQKRSNIEYFRRQGIIISIEPDKLLSEKIKRIK